MARNLRVALRHASTMVRGVNISAFTTAGRKEGANQDTVVVGRPSSEVMENPLLALKKTMTEIRERLRTDQRFEKSGTTVTLVIKEAGERIFVRSFGDSPVDVVFRDSKGRFASLQLTPDQSVRSRSVMLPNFQ